jgi:outer membrane scaffolding protein for murein synthesis (MipA/OmpV family)
LEGGLPLGKKWSLDSRISSTYGSSSYMDTYFSVDSDNAVRSGLPTYDAGAGFKDVEINAMLSRQIYEYFGIGLIGTYRRYIDGAKESPVVSGAGSPNTFIGAVVATVRY